MIKIDRTDFRVGVDNAWNIGLRRYGKRGYMHVRYSVVLHSENLHKGVIAPRGRNLYFQRYPVAVISPEGLSADLHTDRIDMYAE